jgi:hypothetical protein
MSDAPRVKPAVTTTTVTIAAGTAVSTAADLSAGNVTMLLMPSDWTPANLGFLISEDNVTYRDLHDANGMEIQKATGPNRAINVDTSFTSGALWVKVRSGSLNNPILQAADRVIVLVIQ